MTRPRVVIDLDEDAGRARDLARGGAFVPGLQLPELAECDLVLQRAGRELALPARVVMVGGGGCGLEVVGFGAAVRERIASTFGDLAAKPAPAAPAPEPEPEPDPVPELATEPVPALDADVAPHEASFAPEDEDDALELPEPLPADGPSLLPQLPEELDVMSLELDTSDDVSTHGARSGDEELLDLEAEDDPPAVAPDAETLDDGDDDDATDEPGRKIAKNVHERVRGLNLAQQIKLAHTGETAERIILERLYGKHVWEALLRNPRITGPEVARIARMGQLPRPLIEIIVGNGGWLQIPEVRRSLLSNPRLATDQIQRVLTLLPKHELKLAAVQSAYPHTVRDLARRMVAPMKK